MNRIIVLHRKHKRASRPFDLLLLPPVGLDEGEDPVGRRQLPSANTPIAASPATSSSVSPSRGSEALGLGRLFSQSASALVVEEGNVHRTASAVIRPS